LRPLGFDHVQHAELLLCDAGQRDGQRDVLHIQDAKTPPHQDAGAPSASYWPRMDTGHGWTLATDGHG
jgi:hypothetical protein